MAQQHTILLIQKTKLKSSRTFTDHESIGHSLEYVIGMFETALKESKPDARSVTYALQDLNDFVDTHVELCALVFSPQTQSYTPHDKEWLKERILGHLQKAAGL